MKAAGRVLIDPAQVLVQPLQVSLGLEVGRVSVRRCHRTLKAVIRTLKSQGLWVRTSAGLDDLRAAGRAFVERDTSQWLIERHGHKTPREA